MDPSHPLPKPEFEHPADQYAYDALRQRLWRAGRFTVDNAELDAYLDDLVMPILAQRFGTRL